MTSGAHRAGPSRAGARRGGARRAEPRGRAVRQRGARRFLALALAVVASLMLLHAREVRVGEAWVQGRLLQALGVDVHLYGTVVLVRLHGHFAGISLTTGCSIGPLLAVFLLACVPFVWYRSMPLTRVVAATLQLAAVLVLANEIRIAAIVLSIRQWGLHHGYEISHVFVGSAISTLGFVAGAVLFARMFVARRA